MWVYAFPHSVRAHVSALPSHVIEAYNLYGFLEKTTEGLLRTFAYKVRSSSHRLKGEMSGGLQHSDGGCRDCNNVGKTDAKPKTMR